jgi:hypothetical protein
MGELEGSKSNLPSEAGFSFEGGPTDEWHRNKIIKINLIDKPGIICYIGFDRAGSIVSRWRHLDGISSL